MSGGVECQGPLNPSRANNGNNTASERSGWMPQGRSRRRRRKRGKLENPAPTAPLASLPLKGGPREARAKPKRRARRAPRGGLTVRAETGHVVLHERARLCKERQYASSSRRMQPAYKIQRRSARGYIQKWARNCSTSLYNNRDYSTKPPCSKGARQYRYLRTENLG